MSVYFNQVRSKFEEKNMEKCREKLSVEERVFTVVSEQLAISKEVLTRKDSSQSLGIDSLDFVEIIMEIEDEFDINLPDSLTKGATLGQLIDYIESLPKGEPA
jgi:acyl carrier protein